MVWDCSNWAGKDRINNVPVYVCSKCPEAITIHACEPCLNNISFRDKKYMTLVSDGLCKTYNSSGNC